MNTSIAQAVQRAGGQSALANAIHSRHPNIKQQHVWKWLRAGRVPAEYALAIEAATGISIHELRPDIYPDKDRQRAA